MYREFSAIKKTTVQLLIKSCILIGCFCSIFLSLSFGTQNKFSFLKSEISNYSVQEKKPLFFSIYSDKKVETFIENQTLNILKNSFYSFVTASRLYDNGYYFSFEYDEKHFDCESNLLETVERPRDSVNFINHGNLQSACAETISVGSFSTNYGFLSSTNDAIYIPEYYGEMILNIFGLYNLKQIVYSEKQNSEFKSLVKVKLKNSFDDSFEYECRLRGVYKDNTILSNQIESISQKNDKPVIICSPGLFDRCSLGVNKLICYIKSNSPSAGVYKRFFNIIESLFDKNSLSLDFQYNTDDSIVETVNRIMRDFDAKFYNNNRWLFVLLDCLFIVCTIIITFIFSKKYRTIRIISIVYPIVVFVILALIFSRISFGSFVLLTRKSLYYSIPLLVIVESISVIFSTTAAKQSQRSFCEVNI